MEKHQNLALLVPSVLEQLSGVLSLVLQMFTLGVVTIIIVGLIFMLVFYLQGNSGDRRSGLSVNVHRESANFVHGGQGPVQLSKSIVRERTSLTTLQRKFNEKLRFRQPTSQPAPPQDNNLLVRYKAILVDKGEVTTDSLTSNTELLKSQLHQANEELSMERDKSLCVVCLDANREILVKPCNHYCLCSGCSKELRECPMCKTRIQRTEKIFHA